ncbi:MAG: hypothetical protein JW881_10370 [Spirochaetales bacterium]|nr:hypothetical protein [Spirochaetales bacterium]
MINMIFWSWCFPQTLLGFVIYSFYRIRGIVVKTEKYNHATVVYIRTTLFTGVSLGKYIIVNETEIGNLTTIRHEYGHTRQSFIVGVFYLVVVAVPSIIRNITWRIKKYPVSDYYKGYPEDWADRLGGVTR